jgi:hypothetical protein
MVINQLMFGIDLQFNIFISDSFVNVIKVFRVGLASCILHLIHLLQLLVFLLLLFGLLLLLLF